MIRIEEAATAEQLDAVRSRFRTFVAWHHATPVDDRRLIARYFDQAAFEAELRDLPGAYAGPKGGLLLGWIGKGPANLTPASLTPANLTPANLTPANLTPAGCVALRDLGDGVCEMKRMFVLPQVQRQGLGLQLADRNIATARAAGWLAMRLDTSKRQIPAIKLDERFGFTRVESHSPLTPDLADWLVFFEKTL